MPLRETAPLGAPCWIELFTSDPDTTESFYNELFGWTCESAGEEYGNYFNFSKDGHRVGGGMKNDGSGGAPDGWSVYLATDDAEAAADAAVANGGTVIMPPMQVMALGSMVVLGDTGGAAIGGWQPGEHKGFAVHGEPGTACWFELHTRDYDKSVEFYKNVFHWDAHVMSDTSEFRYTTYGEGETQLAGIMDASAMLPEGVPAHWSIYFGVKDADAALAEIVELGGSVVLPAEDTPYGRLATAADPTGAVFKLRA
jgi:predicted enzyme related to lactoylglutathione lyase